MCLVHFLIVITYLKLSVMVRPKVTTLIGIYNTRMNTCHFIFQSLDVQKGLKFEMHCLNLSRSFIVKFIFFFWLKKTYLEVSWFGQT
jgi:hypothetical protein